MHYLGEAESLMPGIESKLLTLKIAPSEILTADGRVIYQVSTELRESVPISAVPQRVRDAVIEAEDRRFYEHHGIDFWGLARAATSGAKEGHVSQGASTIPMQLAKRLHSAGERTVDRKLLDMAIAEKLEEQWSKDHILELYLNQVYFGSGAYGIQTAAKTYFGKDVGHLTLGEAAMLARCVRTPSRENPFINYDKAEANRDVVLKSMLEDGKITQAQFDEASNEDDQKNLAPHNRDANGRIDQAPYVVTAVLKELKEQFPNIHLAEGGYKIYTNIDWDMQRAAERGVQHAVSRNAEAGVNNAAFVMMDGEGRIKALVGGANFKKNQYNTVVQGHRQPGSAFKPFVYAVALSRGRLELNSSISNERLVYTDPSTGRTWSPRNDNGKYGGMVSLRSALAASINVPAVRTILDVGVGDVVQYSKDVFGFTSDLPEYPPLALGACDVSPLEMAEAYSVFMLRGSRAKPFLIDKIEENGNLVAESAPRIARDVLSPSVCDEMDTLLRAVVTGGTGTRAAVVPNARGKTGTTSQNKDAWFCGYANGLLGIGWVGNEQYSKRLKAYVPVAMRRSVFGGTVTAPFWAEVMGAAYGKFGDRYARSENLPSDAERMAPDSKKAEDALPKDDTQIPIDINVPNPNGSPDQRNPPVTGGDPTAVVAGPGHGANPNPESHLPAPPPDPTLAEPKPLRHAPPPERPAPRPVVHAQPREVEYVDVEICADSGELATDYCPETVTRRFVKGRQPRRRCHVHRG